MLETAPVSLDGPSPAEEAETVFPTATELTEILDRHREGADPDNLVAAIYQDIHRIARGRRLGATSNQTWQTTDLANEAFLRFLKHGKVRYRDRASFLALAAKVVRNLIIEKARAKRRLKRDAGGVRVALDPSLLEHEHRALDLVALDEALDRLAKLDPQAAQVVELRFFGDYSEAEVARILDVSVRTVQRDWSSARAFLHAQLR